MGGNMAGWSRLRIGSYRAILQITIIEVDEVLYVDAIGPRGDLLIRLQAQFDYQKAFHGKNPDLQMEVRAIA